MPRIRQKHLDRREWYNDSDRDFVCRYHRDDRFDGGIGLITFTGIGVPMTVRSVNGMLCIADRGYQWLELALKNGHFVITAMFREGRLFQQYIDITLKNEVDERGDAVFYDLLLDIVIQSGREPVILDRDELDDAYACGAITGEQYDLALDTADRIMREYLRHGAEIEQTLYGYLQLLS